MAFAPAIVMWASLAGAAVAAYGAYQQGQAAKKSANYNAQVAQQNALIARQQARLRAQQQDRNNRLRMGTIRANAGASGGVANEGSVLDIISDNAIQNELAKQEILHSGEIKAAGFTNTATLDRFQGRAAERAGNLKAGSAIIGGASSAASSGQGAALLNRGG